MGTTTVQSLTEHCARTERFINEGGRAGSNDVLKIIRLVRETQRYDAEQMYDALSGLIDWVKEGIPEGGEYALVEAEAALRSMRVVRLVSSQKSPER